MKRRSMRDCVVERDPPVRVDQICGICKHAILPMHTTADIIDDHRPRDAVLALMGHSVPQLVVVRCVWLNGRAGMPLADQYVDELHLGAPADVQLLQWLDRADIDGSTVGSEVQQRRLTSMFAETPARTVRCRQFEVGCQLSRLHAPELPGANCISCKMAGAKVFKVVRTAGEC